jgi:oxygen-dependent protoporphyrinogen oxidase
MKRIVIIGGGISGLTVAYALLNSSYFSLPTSHLEIMVLEAESRPGGKIWTDKVNGFLCEKGPNGFLDNKPKTLELCENLGIKPLRSNENAKKRYIFSNERLNLLPESMKDFMKSSILSLPGKFRIVYELIAPKGPEEETIAQFVIRRLGREALEKLIDPMVSGVFAGDPYKLSIKSCFPRIKELEHEYGSLIRAMIRLQKAKKKVGPAPGGTLTSFEGGIQTLTDALAKKLSGKLQLGVSVKGLERRGNLYQLQTSEGIIEADIVVLATPAYVSSEILRNFDKELSKILLDIPYPPISVVCFGYRRQKVENPLRGFGFLVPHKERRKILGTLWDSSIFPHRSPEGYVLLRTMVGGAQSSEIAMLDDERLIDTVMDELSLILGIKTDPDMVRIYRWERAIPQYVTGHGKKLEFIAERLKSHPNLYITGNAYKGIGINDCVENSYQIAEEIIKNAY